MSRPAPPARSGRHWLLAANAFNRALTLGTQLVVGFLLLPEQVGTFAVAAGVVGMASPFQSGDHARLALQERDDPVAAAAALRNWLLLGSLATCVIAVFALPALGIAVARAPLACLAVLSLLRVMGNARVALLSRAGRSTAIAVAGASEGSARSLVLVGTALLGAGMWSLVAGEVAAVLASNVLLARLEPGPPRGGLRLPSRMWRRLGATVGVCLLVGVELNCSAVAIGHFCSAAAAGGFAFANRMAAQLTVLLLPLITLEAIPRLIAARDALPHFLEASRRECRRLLVIAGPMVAVLALAGPPLVVLVWGERWREAAGMLRWLALSVGLRLAYAMAKAHLEASGGFGRILLLSAIDTALIVAVVVATGMLGSASAMVMALAGESALILVLAAGSARTQARRTLPAQ